MLLIDVKFKHRNLLHYKSHGHLMTFYRLPLSLVV